MSIQTVEVFPVSDASRVEESNITFALWKATAFFDSTPIIRPAPFSENQDALLAHEEEVDVMPAALQIKYSSTGAVRDEFYKENGRLVPIEQFTDAVFDQDGPEARHCDYTEYETIKTRNAEYATAQGLDTFKSFDAIIHPSSNSQQSSVIMEDRMLSGTNVSSVSDSHVFVSSPLV